MITVRVEAMPNIDSEAVIGPSNINNKINVFLYSSVSLSFPFF